MLMNMPLHTSPWNFCHYQIKGRENERERETGPAILCI